MGLKRLIRAQSGSSKAHTCGCVCIHIYYVRIIYTLLRNWLSKADAQRARQGGQKTTNSLEPQECELKFAISSVIGSKTEAYMYLSSGNRCSVIALSLPYSIN